MADSSTSQERIGDFLVKIGAMSHEERDEVVKTQQSQPGRLFGEIAIELGYIRDDAVDAFLNRSKQQGE